MAEFTTATGFQLSAAQPNFGPFDSAIPELERLQWSDGTAHLDLTGTGLLYQTQQHGQPVFNVIGGTFTGLSLDRFDHDLQVTGLALSAKNLYAAIDDQNWAGFLAKITSGDDIFTGANAADVVEAGDGEDILYGGGGNDVLNGGLNDDTLTGGLGNDTLTGGFNFDNFVFNVKPIEANADTITDFSVRLDHISLESARFAGVGPSGDILAKHFHIGAAALTKAQHIIYDPTTGDLKYDHDGRGSEAAVTFMHLSAGLALEASNILIF